MNIKTVFDAEQDVYVIKDSTIAKYRVVGFNINASEDSVNITCILRNYILLGDYYVKLGNEVIEVAESECYGDVWSIKTKFEFLEKLICLTNEEQEQNKEEKQIETSNNINEEDDLPF